MRRIYTLLLLTVLVSSTLYPQIGIKTVHPDPSSALEVHSKDKGVLVPRMSATERDLIRDPAVGLIIYNTSTQCNEYYTGKSWYNLCWRGTTMNLPYSNGTAIVDGYSCNGDSTGTLIKSTAAYNVSQTISANVVSAGSYDIRASVNGVTFYGKGEFAKRGYNDVVLKASGTPVEVGDYTFVVNTVPNCEYNRVVYNSETGGTSIFSINDCSVAIGSLLKGNRIVSGVEQELSVNVTKGGTYNITAFSDGVEFKGSGELEEGKDKKIVIIASGTPNISGVSAFSLNLSPTCTFNREVNEPVTITKQPVAPVAICSGNGVRTIKVEATGTKLSYQWRRGGVAVVNGDGISGQGTSTITFTNPSVSLAGSYDVVVTGVDSVTSIPVPLVVNGTPVIKSAPAVEIYGKGDVDLVVEVSEGSTPKWYVEEKDATPISTETAFKTYLANSATFYVAATLGSCNSVSRTAVEARVKVPFIKTQPVASASMCSNMGVQTLSVECEGAATFKWRKDGMTLVNGGIISGQGTSALKLSNPSVLNSGNYDVVVSNSAGSVISTATVITINQVPVFTNWSNGNISSSTRRAVLSAIPSKGNVKWYEKEEGGDVVATGSTFTTPALETNKTYYAVAENSGCTSSSAISVRAVYDLPTINVQPADPTPVCSGNGMQRLSVSASGNGLKYTWKKEGVILVNGTVISGQGTPTLTLSNPTEAEAGRYNVTVSNDWETVSNTATVVVYGIPEIKTKTDATVCKTSVAELSVTVESGVSVNWYSTTSSTNLLGTGLVFSTPAISNTTTYFAEAVGTDSGCKSISRTGVTVTVKSTPTVTINSAQTRCGAGTVSLNATVTDGDKLKWYNSEETLLSEIGSSQAYISSEIEAGSGVTYKVSGYNSTTKCESAMNRVVVSANVVPEISTTENTITKCGAGAVDLTATVSNGGDKIRWYNAAGVMTEQNLLEKYTSGILGLGSNNKFSVSAYNSLSKCESEKKDIQVTISPIPTVSAEQSIVKCASGSVELSASTSNGGDKLRWYNGAGDYIEVLAGAKYQTGVLILGETANFKVSAYNSVTQCESMKIGVKVEIKANALPVISTVSNVKACGGVAGLIATVSGGDKVRWYDSAGVMVTTINSGASYNTATITDGDTTKYSVEGYNSLTQCTSAKTEVTVSGAKAPTVVTDTNIYACGATSVALNATAANGGDKVKWYNAGGVLQQNLNSGAQFTVTAPAINGTIVYKVSGYNSVSGCESVMTDVTVHNTAVPTAVPTKSVVTRCATGTIDLTATPNSSTDKFRWYTPEEVQTELNIGDTYTTAAIEAGSGTIIYKVSGYNSTSKCESAKTSITVSATFQPTVEANSIFTRCGAGVVSLTAKAINGDRVRWYADGATVPNEVNAGEEFNSTNVLVGTDVRYSVSAYNTASKCESAKTEIRIIATAVPTIIATVPQPRCGTGSVSLTATAGNGGTKVKWYNSEGVALGTFNSGYNYKIASVAEGTISKYFVAGVNATSGCESEKQEIEVKANEVPVVSTAADVYVCGGGIAELEATLTGGDILKWYSHTGVLLSSLNKQEKFVTTTVTEGSSLMYKVRGYNSVTTCESEEKLIVVYGKSLPTVLVQKSFTGCEGAVASVIARSGNGIDKIRWYTADGTEPEGEVESGVTYLTKSTVRIGEVVTYRVSSYDAVTKCESAKTEVSLNSIPQPTVTVANTNVTRCGNGVVTIVATIANGNKLRWYYLGEKVGETISGEVFTTTEIAVGESAKVYEVEGYNSNNLCLSPVKTQINVSAVVMPTITTEETKTRCGTGTVELVALAGEGADKIRWYNSSDEPQGEYIDKSAKFTTGLIATGAAVVTYKVASYNSVTQCRSAFATVSVSANSMPQVSTPSTTVNGCGAGVVNLTATASAGGDKINWYNAAKELTTVESNATFATKALAIGEIVAYTAKAFNSATNCESAIGVTVSVTAMEQPTVVIESNQSRCGAGSVSLVASAANGGDKVKWFNAAGNAEIGTYESGAAFLTPNISVGETITYNVAGFNSVTGCLSDKKVINVTANQLPIVSTTDKIKVCGTGSVNLTATTIDGDKIKWYNSDNVQLGELLESGATFTTTIAVAPKTYIFKVAAVKSSTGCESPKTTVNVEAIGLPTVNTVANVVSCGTGIVKLRATAVGGDKIMWYNAAGVEQGVAIFSGEMFTTTVITAGATPIVYKVKALESTTNCYSAEMASVTVTANSMPSVSTTPTVERCGTGTVVLTATAGGGATKVRWFNNISETSITTITSGVTFITDNIEAGKSVVYRVASYDEVTGCESEKATVTVNANDLPTVDTAILVSNCGATAPKLRATAIGGNKVKWYNSAMELQATVNSEEFYTSATSAPAPGTANYYVASFNSITSCESAKTKVTVTGVVLPTITTRAIVTRCGTGTVNLTATSVSGADAIRWYGADGAYQTTNSGETFTTASVEAGTEIKYTVKGYNNTTNCESVASVVRVVANVFPSVKSLSKVSETDSKTAELTATTDNADKVKWYDESNTPQAEVKSGDKYVTPEIPEGETVTYKVSAYDTSSECESPTLMTLDVRAGDTTPAVTTEVNVSKCGSQEVSLVATAVVNTTAVKIKWYSSSDVLLTTTPLDSGTPYSVGTLAVGNYTYKVSGFDPTTSLESSKTEVSVTVVRRPTVGATTAYSRCSSGAINVTATATDGNQVRWYNSSDVLLTGGVVTQNTPFISPSVSIGTPLVLKVDAFNSTASCASTDKITVTLTAKELPTVTVPSSSVNSCGDTTVDIVATAGGATKIKWYNSSGVQVGGELTSGDTFTTPEIPAGTSALYNVTSYNTTTECESAKTEVTVRVNARPTVAIPSTAVSFCGTGTTKLRATATGGDQVRWYNAAGSTLISTISSNTDFITSTILAGTATVTYQVSGYDSTSACESETKTAVTVTANSLPAVVTTEANVTSCGTNSVNLTASTTESNCSIKWYNDAEVYQGTTASGVAFSTAVINSGTTVVYKATVFNTSTTCESAKTSITVRANAIPVVVTSTAVSVCGGAFASLIATATDGNQVKWYNSTDVALGTVSSGATYITTTAIQAPGTVNFKVEAFNSSTNCSSAKTIVVVTGVVPPTATVSATASRCGTGTVDISATTTDGDRIRWYDENGDFTGTQVSSGGIFRTAIINAGASKTYKVTAYSTVTKCESPVKKDIVVSAISSPTVSIERTSETRCGAGAFILTAIGQNGGDKVKWYSSSDVLLATLPSGDPYTTPTVAVGSVVIYKVSAYTSTGCGESAKTEISVRAIGAPVVNVEPTFSRCGNGVVALKATASAGGDKIKWYNSSNTSTTVESGAVFNTGDVLIGTPQEYKVSAYNSTTLCESAQTTVNVIANIVPTISIASNFNRCGDGSVQLTATVADGANVVKWYSAAGSELSSLSPTEPYTTPILSAGLTSKVFKVKGYNSNTNCLSTEASTSVIANMPPTVTVPANTYVCTEGVTTITASSTGGDMVQWYNSLNVAQGSPITQGTPFTTGVVPVGVEQTYYVEAINTVTTCKSAKLTAKASVTPTSSMGISTETNAKRCGTDTVDLVAIAIGADKVQWYSATDVPIGSPILSGAAFKTAVINAGAEATIYKVTAYNSNGGCESLVKTRVSVVANSAPTAPTVASSLARCGTGTVSLRANATDVDKLRWYDATGYNILLEADVSTEFVTPSISVGSRVDYKVASYNSVTLCESSTKILAQAISNALPTVQTESSSLTRCGAGTVNLVATAVGGDMVRWYNALEVPLGDAINSGSTYVSPSIAVNSTVQFNVSAYNSTTKCSSAMTRVSVTSNPLPNVYANANQSRCESGTIDLVATVSGGADKLRWYFGDTPFGLINSTEKFTTPTSIVAGTTAVYKVVAINSSTTCESSAVTVNAKANYLPTARVSSELSRCGAGNFELIATVTNGDQVKWYSAINEYIDTVESDGTFITPIMGEGTTKVYKMYAYNSTTECISAVNSINVITKTLPVISTSLSLTRCGAGAIDMKATVTNGGNQIKWYNSADVLLNTLPSELIYTSTDVAIGTPVIYKAAAYNSTTNCISEKARITLTANILPIISTATTVERCGSGTVSLIASITDGDILKWYDFDNNFISTGTSGGTFVTPKSLAEGQSVIYKVLARNTSTGCESGMTEITTTANIVPTAETTTTRAICGTGTAVLTAIATGGDKVKWYNAGGILQGAAIDSGANFTTGSITSGSTVSYKVSAYNSTSKCESARIEVLVTSKTLPTLATNANVYICGLGTAKLTANATGADSIRWYDSTDALLDTVPTGAEFTTYDVVVGTPSTYKAEAYDSATTCKSLAKTNVRVTANEAPIVTTTENVSSCGNKTVVLRATVSGGTEIKWYDESNNYLATGSVYTTNVITEGTVVKYKVTGRNTTMVCESAYKSITVTANALPVATTAATVARCGTGTVNLLATAIGGDQVKWYSDGTVRGTVASGQPFVTPVIQSGGTAVVYKVAAFNSATQCESVTQSSVTISVSTAPSVLVESNQSRCGTGAVSLSAIGLDGATRVRWYTSTGALISEIASGTKYDTPSMIAGSASVSYQVAGYNPVNDCMSTLTSVNATAYAIPTVVAPTSVYGCGTSIVKLIATSANGGDQVKWYDNSGLVQGDPIDSGSVFDVNFVPVGTTVIYKVSGYNSTSGCETATKRSVIVTGTALPTLLLTAVTVTRCGTGTVKLVASVQDGGGRIKWYDVSNNEIGEVDSGAVFTSPNSVAVEAPVTFKAAAFNSTTQCESVKKSVIATANVLPGAVSINTTVVNCGALPVKLIVSQVEGGDKVKWYDSADKYQGVFAVGDTYTTPALTQSSTIYKVAGFNSVTGCEAATTTSVNISTYSLTPVTTNTNVHVCGAQLPELRVSASVGDRLKWYNSSDEVIAETAATEAFTPPIVPTGTTVIYKVVAYNSTLGCESAKTTVKVTSATLPSLTTESSVSRCGTGTLTLKSVVTSGDKVRWYNAAGELQSEINSTDNFTAGPVTVGTPLIYRAAAYNSTTSCESGKIQVRLDAEAVPVLTTTTLVETCGAVPVNLTASIAGGEGKVVWYNSAGIEQAVLNSGDIYVTPTIPLGQTVRFKVLATKPNSTCKSALTEITVTSKTLPTVSTSALVERCGTGTVDLVAYLADGGTKVRWYSEAGQLLATLNSGATYTTASIPAGNVIKFKVTGTNESTGCASAGTVVSVKTNSLPTFSTLSNVIICGAGTANLVGCSIGGDKVKWYDSTGVTELQTLESGASFTTIRVEAGTSYTYKLAAYNSVNGCIGEAKGTVVVSSKGLPTVSTNSNVTICGTETNLKLNASVGNGGNMVRWYDSAGLLKASIDPTVDSFTPAPVSLGGTARYAVAAYSSATGCESTQFPVEIISKLIPTVTTSTPTVARCGAGDVNLVATAANVGIGAKVRWYLNGILVSNTPEGMVASGSTYTTASLAESLTQYNYTAQAVDVVSGCVSQTYASATVTVRDIPTIAFTQSWTGCAGASISVPFTVVNGNQVRWYAVEGTAVTGTNNTVQGGVFTWNSTYDVTKAWQVTGYNSTTGCESKKAGFSVTANPIPTIAFTQSWTGCAGASISVPFTVANGNQVRWYAVEGTTVTGTNNTVQGGVFTWNSTYVTQAWQVTGYNSTTGCESKKAGFSVTGNPVPTITVATTTMSGCSGFNFTTPISSTNGTHIIWYDTAGNQARADVATSLTWTGTYTNVQYDVISWNSTTGCSSPKTRATITVAALPAAPTVTNGSVCGSGTVALSASSSDPGSVIDWYTTATGGTAFQTLETYSPSLSATTSYYVASRNTTSGCVSTSRSQVDGVVLAMPPHQITLQPATWKCATSTAQSLTLKTASNPAYCGVSWYDAPTGGTRLSTDFWFDTPELSTPRQYYATARHLSSGCELPNRVSGWANAINPVIKINSFKGNGSHGDTWYWRTSPPTWIFRFQTDSPSIWLNGTVTGTGNVKFYIAVRNNNGTLATSASYAYGEPGTNVDVGMWLWGRTDLDLMISAGIEGLDTCDTYYDYYLNRY